MAPKILLGFSRLPPRTADNENTPVQTWSEGLTTAVAVSAAVVVVAMIALVMGMATP
jgi:hypothetical protein